MIIYLIMAGCLGLIATFFWIWLKMKSPAAEKENVFTKEGSSIRVVKKRLEKMMQTDPQNPAKIEQWYITQVQRFPTHRRVHNASTPEKQKESNKRRVLLIRGRHTDEEAAIVAQGFLDLKGSYLGVERKEDALRMSRFAAIYRNLTAMEREWALSTAAELGIDSGYWLGEAAYDFVYGRKSAQSLKILQMAAGRGNEYSQIILNEGDR